MQASLRQYRNTLIIVLLLASVAGVVYAYSLSIPAPVAAAVLTAILLEIALYLAPGFDGVRKRIEAALPPARLAGALTVSATLPYCIYAAPSGQFRWTGLAALAGMAAAVSFWYVVLPRRAAVDVGFVLLMASAILFKAFSYIYLQPAPKLRMEFLGQLMWIRLGIVAALSIGRVHLEGGFSFLPNRKEWLIGLRYALYFLPVAVLMGLALEFVRFHPRPGGPGKLILLAVGTFIGMLFVVALSEEFFFRGLLLEWFAGWFKSQWAGLLLAAALFGLVHLPFRAFPNWEFALLAGTAGVFYGRAYLAAGSIRAAMVAHALINTLWRVLFS